MFDMLDEFNRVFWKNMTFDVAVAEARTREPFLGAFQVVPASAAAHGEKVAR